MWQATPRRSAGPSSTTSPGPRKPSAATSTARWAGPVHLSPPHSERAPLASGEPSPLPEALPRRGGGGPVTHRRHGHPAPALAPHRSSSAGRSWSSRWSCATPRGPVREHAGPPGALPSLLCRLPAFLGVRRGTGLKVIHLMAAVWSLATGKEEEGEGSGPPENTPQAPPSDSSCSFSLDLKNTLAEDTFNNVFLLKKNTATCSPSVRRALPSRGCGRGGARGARCCWPAPARTAPWPAARGRPAPPGC